MGETYSKDCSSLETNIGVPSLNGNCHERLKNAEAHLAGRLGHAVLRAPWMKSFAELRMVLE